MPGPSADAATDVRTVVVRSPSARREAGLVLRAVFHIVFWSGLVIGVERGTTHAGTSAVSAGPQTVGEVAFGSLDQGQQLVFRQLKEGMIEAEADRSRTGKWPAAEELARRLVPPFAPDPTDKARYRWTELARGTVLNYVGAPDPASGRPTFVVVVVEPDPGTPIDPQAQTDEIHHRLADGTMLHVYVWTAPGVRPIQQVLAAPAPEDGWQRITTQKP